MLTQICGRSGLSPSLFGNAVAWGMYWVAWKSLHGYHVAQQNGEELSWSMKLMCGMQAGAHCNTHRSCVEHSVRAPVCELQQLR